MMTIESNNFTKLFDVKRQMFVLADAPLLIELINNFL